LDEVVGSTAGLLDRARQLGLPIYFTTIAFDDAELDTLMWLQKMPVLRALRSGTPWVEVDPRLAPRRGEPVVRKKAASAFFGTDLARVLRAAGVDALLICGATTSGCVRASAIDACAWGFPSRVVRECVGDRAPEPHEANLLDIDAKYADVISLETAFSDFDRTVISR
jgi:nicotinamidase-related amidase